MNKVLKLLGIIVLVAVTGFTMAGCKTDDDGPKTLVTLNPTTLTLDVDQWERIDAETDPADARLTWTSSNTAVATVDYDDGSNYCFIKGESEGTAVITAAAADGGKASCTVTVLPPPESDVEIIGETLVHSSPHLVGVNHFGNNLGANNEDGSYTFDGTAGAWSGGGAQYTFPTPKSSDTWKIADYQAAEVHLNVISGSVTVGVKKFGGNIDLKPYPDASNSISFNAASNGGKFTYKIVIEETGAGIGFQRNTGGPAVVAIEKVVLSKAPVHTISFAGGEHTAMPAIPPIKIPHNRTVNFSDDLYTMPARPQWSGHAFTGWKTADGSDFNPSDPITSDLTLTAQWREGDLQVADMRLNLDPAAWGPLPQNAPAQTGGWTWPSNYAETDYDSATGVLTLTFDGNNRQRAIIPLSSDQIDELIYTGESGVTFRIVGTVKDEDGNDSSAEFRCHLGNPTTTSAWNGTQTGAQTALANHLVEYRPFEAANKGQANLSWFMIQAMYKDAAGSDTVQFGFPKVIITIESITIELGDTSAL